MVVCVRPNGVDIKTEPSQSSQRPNKNTFTYWFIFIPHAGGRARALTRYVTSHAGGHMFCFQLTKLFALVCVYQSACAFSADGHRRRRRRKPMNQQPDAHGWYFTHADTVPLASASCSRGCCRKWCTISCRRKYARCPWESRIGKYSAGNGVQVIRCVIINIIDIMCILSNREWMADDGVSGAPAPCSCSTRIVWWDTITGARYGYCFGLRVRARASHDWWAYWGSPSHLLRIWVSWLRVRITHRFSTLVNTATNYTRVHDWNV